MLRKSATIVAALLAPAALWAAESAVLPDDDAPAVVFRLSADGDWIGAARADGTGDRALYVAPLQPTPRAASPLTIGGLFSVPAGDSQRIGVGIQQRVVPTAMAVSPVVPAWCQSMVGMVANSADCALGTAPGLMPQPPLTRRQGVATYAGPEFDLAVTVGSNSGWSPGGSAWLVGPLGDPLGAPANPGLFNLGGYTESREVGLSGLWRVAPWGGLTISAAVADSTWQLVPGTAPLAVDQAALQLGVVRGAFSGGITGRVMRGSDSLSSDGDPLWTGLDIGIAWRTPWRGELAIGAQNLIGRSREAQPAPAAPALDEATARTPYVRYTQDL
jgi:hypothetical protein